MASSDPESATHRTGGQPRTTPVEHELTVRFRAQPCPSPRLKFEPENSYQIAGRAWNDPIPLTTCRAMETIGRLRTSVVQRGTNGHSADSGAAGHRARREPPLARSTRIRR